MVKWVYGKGNKVASGSGSTGSGTSAKIWRFSGKGMALGGKITSGITIVATTTRVASVAVGVGESVLVAVAVGKAVKATVGDDSFVAVAVAEADVRGMSSLGCLSVFSLNSRYTNIEPLAAKRTAMPMMTDHFFKPNLMPLGNL